MKKDINKMKLLAVFSVTTLIFVLGVLLGNFLSNQKLEKIDEIQQELKTDTMAIETEYLLLSQEPCQENKTILLTDELYQINSKIDYMEGRLGENNAEILKLKDYYSLLEIRHWLLLKKIQGECGGNFNFIHYFYSNNGDCKQCKDQGFILLYIRKKFDNVRIYSYDINNNNFALSALKKLYGIKNTPSIIINDKVLEGFTTKDQIEKELNTV
jgi:hypothetical protein